MRDLRFWRRRQAEDDDTDRELAVHLALEADEQVDAGASPHEAQLAAHRAFGSVALTKEELRDMRSGAVLDRLARELRQAARRLVRSPLFTLATVLTLGLAIGANVSIFAVVHRVLLNPLPYGRSDRLIALDYGIPSRNIPSGVSSITSQLYYHYLDRARTLDGLAFYQLEEPTLTGQGGPERLRVSRATPSLASVLRVAPARGRWFTEAEGAPGAAPVALLAHGFWVRKYGRDPAVLGQRVTLNGVPATVIGVMPPAFTFPDHRVEMWLPIAVSRTTATDSFNYSSVARLRDGVTVDDARVELTRLNRGLAATYPGAGYDQFVSTATTLIDAAVGRVATALWILLAAAGLVLLVACANVANLFLVRSDARQREVAVRRALGAGAGGIAGYFLAESALLSLAGGGLGLGAAWGAVHVLVALGPTNLPRLEEVRIDGVALAFAFAMSALTTLAFGSFPLLRLAPVAVSLHEGGRGNTASRVRTRARHVLMAGQIALALVLLVSSGLMLRSFQKLRAINPGFNPASALTFRIGLPRIDYPARGSLVTAHRAMLDRLSALPGVTRVSASTCLPLSELGACFVGPLFVDGRPLDRGTLRPLVGVRTVAGGYFEAMGMRMLRGRGIEAADVERREPIAVVDEALAAVAFPNQDPIGQRVRAGTPVGSSAPGWLTIAGIVSNTPTRALAESRIVPKIYAPMLATPIGLGPQIDAMSYVVRTATPPLDLLPAVRRAIEQVDPKLALAQVRTLQDVLDRASAPMAFTMILLAIAAAVSLMLGVIGIYGVTSYIVSQRTGEIGLRLALGAAPGSVAWLIVRQGAMVAVAGIAAGVAAAVAGGRLMESLLYGVSPRDPGVLAATTVTLLAVALLACWLPARRVARLTPVEALRAE